MDAPVLAAVLIVALGGVMQGSFTLPMRSVRHWAWENVWLAYSIFGLLVIPWSVAYVTVPDLFAIYSSVPSLDIAITALFGFGWGVANVMFGLAVARVGMALSFAIVVGMSAALGSLIPLIFSQTKHLGEPSGLLVIAGVVLTLIGVVLLGSAGRAKEANQENLNRAGRKSGSARAITVGLVLCIVAGTLAPMLNFSFAFGSAIIAEAAKHDITPTIGINAIWAVALTGGFVSNAGYCGLLLLKNRSFSYFLQMTGNRVQWALCVSMGLLWSCGIFLYGFGASLLGDLGPALGWPVFQATIVITASLIGFRLPEWQKAEPYIVRRSRMGLAVLVAAIVVLSFGNRM